MKRLLSKGYLLLLLVMLYAPIIIIAIFSFTESRVLGNWTGFSTELYTSLFSGGVPPRLPPRPTPPLPKQTSAG